MSDIIDELTTRSEYDGPDPQSKLFDTIEEKDNEIEELEFKVVQLEEDIRLYKAIITRLIGFE